MGAAVAPAVGTAFGTSAVASMAAAPVFMAAAAAPIAASTASMMMNTTALSGGGGFFGGLSSMFSSLNSPLGGLLGDASIMDLGFGVSKGLGFMQDIRQGQMMKNQYELQALQSLNDAETAQYNAVLDGMDRFDKLKRMQAASHAYASARGVYGLDGSALLNQIISDQEYGKDYKISEENIKRLGSTGKINADIYKATARSAVTDSVIDGTIKLGEAAYSYDKLYGV